MKIYKELESLGFFEWYCTQYGGIVYQEYRDVYDDLPLDNLIRTELNACVFKFFRDKYRLCGWVVPYFKLNGSVVYDYLIYTANYEVRYCTRNIYEESEIECVKLLIQTVKEK